jgi:hypothetical protein
LRVNGAENCAFRGRTRDTLPRQRGYERLSRSEPELSAAISRVELFQWENLNLFLFFGRIRRIFQKRREDCAGFINEASMQSTCAILFSSRITKNANAALDLMARRTHSGLSFSDAILSISLRVFSVFVGWKNLLFGRNFSGQL